MDPETAPLIRGVYVIFCTEFDQIKADLTARTPDQWAALESADLVRLALTALSVREGIETCLRPDFDFMNDPWLRRFLYWCLVLGHAPAAAADDPLALVAGAMQYELVDPYVRAEIKRRGSQHPAGMHAWMLANVLRTQPAGRSQPNQGCGGHPHEQHGVRTGPAGGCAAPVRPRPGPTASAPASRK
jgi:hypothetical protein